MALQNGGVDVVDPSEVTTEPDSEVVDPSEVSLAPPAPAAPAITIDTSLLTGPRGTAASPAPIAAAPAAPAAAAAPAPQATIGAAAPTLLQRARALFSNAPQGSLAQQISGNVYQPGQEQEEPELLSFESAATPLEREAHPRLTGLAEVASGLTTPSSAAYIAGSGGIGALEDVAGAGLAKYLPRLVSGLFTAQMVKGLYDTYPAYKAAVDRGDTSEAKRIQTEMGAQGVLSFLSGTHALTGETPIGAAQQGISELANRTNAPAGSLLREIGEPTPEPGTPINVPVFHGKLSEDLATDQLTNQAAARGMTQLREAEQRIPPDEINAPAPAQPPLAPLPAVEQAVPPVATTAQPGAEAEVVPETAVEPEPPQLTGEMHQSANRLFGQLKRDPIAQQFARDSWAAMVQGSGPVDAPQGMPIRDVNYVLGKLRDIQSGESLPSTLNPDPRLSGSYTDDELDAAHQRLVEASSVLQQQSTPGRFEGVAGEQGLDEHGTGEFYGATSLRSMFPWFEDMDETPAQLKSAVERQSGPVYNRLLTAAADYEQTSRRATTQIMREAAPDLDQLVASTRAVDPGLADILERAGNGQLGVYDGSLDQLREWVQSHTDEARSSSAFSDAVDALVDSADAEASPTPSEGAGQQAPPGAGPGERGAPGVLPGLEQAVQQEHAAAGREQGRKLTDEINRPPESIEAPAGEMERGSPLFRGTAASPQNEMFPPKLAELERSGDEAEEPEAETKAPETETVEPSEVTAAPEGLKEEMAEGESEEEGEGEPRTLAQEALETPKQQARDFKRPGAPPAEPTKSAELEPEHMREVMPTAMDRIDEMLTEGTPEEEITPGKKMKATIRKRGGEFARETAIARKALKPMLDQLDGWTPEHSGDFINTIMRGQAHRNPFEAKLAKLIEEGIFDPRRRQMERLPHGAYSHWRENYFPGIWQRPGEVEDWMRRVLAGKRPLEGTASFKKAKVFDDFDAALKKGFKPVSWNPLELVLRKAEEMDKYMMAHRVLADAKAGGFAKFFGVDGKDMQGNARPSDWTRVDDRIGTVYGKPTVPMKEYFDRNAMETLEQVADNLGIKRERGAKMPEHPSAAGYAAMTNPGYVRTRFGTPATVLAHEIGHVLDGRYQLSDKFVNDKALNLELRKLADLRFEGQEAPESFKKYVRTREEKMAVMFEALLHAPDKFRQVAPKTFNRLRVFIATHPELRPLMSADGSTGIASMVLGARDVELPVGGAVVHGYYYMPRDAATVFNNYVSPGLRGKLGSAYQVFRAIGNAENQFNLGLSAYHLGTTSVNSMVSDTALALERAFGKGKTPGERASSIIPAARALSVVGSPIHAFLEGSRLRGEYLSPGTFSKYSDLADAVATAGGRASQDTFYDSGQRQKLKAEIKGGQYVRAAMRAPLAGIEAAASPIMSYVVPRMKLGVFHDLAADALSRANREGWSPEQTQRELDRVWNSVDGRLGQVVYDNVFVNKVAKQLAFGAVRSAGWTGGTISELGGGAVDAGRQLGRIATGHAPELTHRMAYTVGLPLTLGYLGALTYMAYNGKAPDKLRDLYQIPTGRTTSDGRREYVNLPSYMKDVFSAMNDPTRAAMNKAQPLLSTIGELLANRDYYGVEVRHSEDPLATQLKDLVDFSAKQFLPFSIENSLQRKKAGGSLGSDIQSFFGVTPAPRYATMTPAERTLSEYSERFASETRTKEEAAHTDLLHDMEQEYRSGKIGIAQLRDRDDLNQGDIRRIVTEGSEDPLVREFKRAPLEVELKAFNQASADERKELEPILASKHINYRNLTGSKAAELRNRLLEAIR